MYHVVGCRRHNSRHAKFGRRATVTWSQTRSWAEPLLGDDSYDRRFGAFG